MAVKQASENVKSHNVFGHARKPAKMFRVGLYARVSSNDQQTLPMQSRAMREYAARRGWTVALQVREVGSGAAKREARERLLEAARRREIDVVLVWLAPGPLGPIGNRSTRDTPGTGASRRGFRVANGGAGPVHASRSSDGRPAGYIRRVRKRDSAGTNPGRTGPRPAERQETGPATAALHTAEIRKLHRAGVSKSEIARRVQIGRTSVRRILGAKS